MTFEALQFWHWWIAAIALVAIEIFAPGAVFLWIGVAAGVVGLVLFLLPEIAWEYQFLLLAVLSVGAIVAWRAYQRQNPTVTDQPALNRRGAQYVGRVFILDQAIVNGAGKISVDDTTWKVRGGDRPKGARVRVTGLDGTVLVVEPE